MAVHLLSWTGTVPCIDLAAGALAHVPLAALGPTHLPLVLAQDAAGRLHLLAPGEAPGQGMFAAIEIGKGAEDGTISFRMPGSFYATAMPGAPFDFTSATCRRWESFLPVATPDVQRLRDILCHYTPPEGSPPVPAAVSGFALVLGPRVLPLTTLLPLPETGLPGLAPPPAPQIWIQPLGNIGNRALQYLVAERLAELTPGAVIRNVHLELWRRQEPAPSPVPWRSARTVRESYAVDVEGLADCLRRREIDALILDSYAFHLDHYPSRARCRALLLPRTDLAVPLLADDELLCSVRGGEVLQAIHGDYFPLPPAYYRLLAAQTGLKLVFFGQLGDDAYSQGLRAAFPQARFIPGISPEHDFETIRRARHIACAISTFSWLAAWLSQAQSVHLPVGGMFNPVQHPGQLYLPTNDPSFHYVLLPLVKAASLADDPTNFWRRQAHIERCARPAGREEIVALVRDAEGRRTDRSWVRGFNTDWCLSQYQGMSSEVMEHKESALGYYLRNPGLAALIHRPFDPLWYAETYADAVTATAAGRYRTVFEHFLREGEAKGYRPIPA